MTAQTTAAPRGKAQDARRPAARRIRDSRLRTPLLYLVSVALGLGVWQLVAATSGPDMVSSPKTTFDAAVELISDGTLGTSVWASLKRIAIGWALGVVVGAPLGILMGRFGLVRRILDPYVEFFRFIPPVAFVTLAIVWFGIGETSKIVLIFYTSVFLVTINTIAGVMAINDAKLRAAASLGANRWQVLYSVVMPASVPHVVTGARLAMGNSFLTIVSAEMVAADEGLGALIWQSRNYARIDWIFVGIITLGLLGFLCDRLVRLATGRGLRRFGVRV
ncbi:ABC transporter permease [Actinocorallia sp. A-T 12471]|uniref:ABC transporter permease n=1 Tax=Actinocorallia sp. A-T 12471 TaxID=3089813 RepID=UPI0029D1BB4C|nr:ABC transporter permease [Actinocorallia sp. A-T 12471]MDX6741069.1 ABC transporter permease [Actinocorallia sp. A-T 12471]